MDHSGGELKVLWQDAGRCIGLGRPRLSWSTKQLPNETLHFEHLSVIFYGGLYVQLKARQRLLRPLLTQVIIICQ